MVRVRLEPQAVRRTAALRCGDFLRAGRTLPPPAGCAGLVGYAHGPGWDGLQWTQERKLAGCDKVIANSGTEGALPGTRQGLFVREMEHWDAESRAAFLGQWEHLVNEPCPEAG